jgi:hypothetical protein
MKSRLLTLVLLLFLPINLFGQQEDEWPSLSYLRSDYRQVSVVAHVRVREAEVVNTIGGYEDWHLVGEVIESFKGKFRKGAEIEFYHGAEKGFRRELFLGEKIVFLERNFVDKEKRWVLAVLENSTLAFNSDRAAKLRRIRSASLKRHRRANHATFQRRYATSRD